MKNFLRGLVLSATLLLAHGVALAANSVPVTLPALTNSAVAIKSAAGSLTLVHCMNTNAAAVYVQVFNVASPTVGTTPPVLSIGIPLTKDGGFSFPPGVSISGPISVAATTGATNATAPAAPIICNFFLY